MSSDSKFRCRICGSPLEAEDSSERCSFCLLKLGLDAVDSRAEGHASTHSSRSDSTEILSQQGVLANFGDYELLSEVARGGMGVVYRARQKSLNRIVAVKLILTGHLATKLSVNRFRLEAQTAGQLDHPGIIRIYDIGEYETQHYFSMELIDGGSLADCLQEFQLNIEPTEKEHRSQEICIAELMSKVARALDFAHQHGVLHRDLKPSNILIDRDGQPHLTDFGLAKLIAPEKSHASLSNTVVGSPGYVAPEQATGRGTVTIAADVYGLGACLYELITGQPPFIGISAMDTILMAINGDPLPARQLNSRVHQNLETIAIRCLQKEPEKRYPSAAAFADELDRFRRGEPIQARPVTKWETLKLWCRRNPGMAFLLNAFLLSTLIGLSTVLWQWNRAEVANERLSQSVQRLSWDTIDDTLRSGQASRALAGVASLLRRDPDDWKAAMFGMSIMDYTSFPVPAAPVITHSREFTVARLSPDGSTVATASIDGTARLWNAMTSTPSSPDLTHDGAVHWAEFSPNGGFVATCSADKTVRLWDVATGSAVMDPIQHHESVARIQFSGDGRLLLSVTKTSVTVFDIATGNPILGPLKFAGQIAAARLVNNAESQLMLFAALRSGNESQLRVWDVLSGEERYTIDTGPFQYADVSNELTLAATSFRGQIRLWDTMLGQERLEIQCPDGRFEAVRFSPDSGVIAAIGTNQWARIWSTESGLPMTPELPHYYLLQGAAFLDAGSRLLTWGDDSLAQIWNSKTGKRLTEPLLHSNRVIYAESGRVQDQEAFLTTVSHSKSREHFTRPGAAHLWRIRERSTPTLFSVEPDAGGHDGIAVSPDGDWLAIGKTAQNVRVMNAKTAEPVCEPLAVIGSPWGVLFNAQQDCLVVTTSRGQVSFWSLPDGQLLDEPLMFNTTFQPIESGSDGQHFVTGSTDGFVRVWDMATQQLTMETQHGSEINSVAFSTDLQRVASAGEDHRTCVWDTSTGQLIHTLEGHSNEVMRVQFTADGRRLLTASLDNTARLWDAESGEPIAVLPHRGEVIDVACSPDSKWVATASRDRTAMIWDTEFGKPQVRSLFHQQAVRNVSFSPDSERLLTRDFRGLRLWDVADGTPLTIHLQHSSHGGTGFQSNSGGPLFTPDGENVFIGQDSPHALLWKLPVPRMRVPKWFPDFLEAVAGQRVVGDGQMINAVDSEMFQTMKRDLTDSVETDVFTRWAQDWLSGL